MSKDISFVDEHDLKMIEEIPIFNELLHLYKIWCNENKISKPIKLIYPNIAKIIKQMVDTSIDNNISDDMLVVLMLASIVLGINKSYPMTDPKRFAMASKSVTELKNKFGTDRIDISLDILYDSIGSSILIDGIPIEGVTEVTPVPEVKESSTNVGEESCTNNQGAPTPLNPKEEKMAKEKEVNEEVKNDSKRVIELTVSELDKMLTEHETSVGGCSSWKRDTVMVAGGMALGIGVYYGYNKWKSE